MNTDDVPTIEDAEVIKETTNQPVSNPTTPPAQAFDINAYNATLEVVRRRIGILGKAKEELKKLKEMFNDIFINDALYQKADGIVKEAMKKRKEIQAQLTKQPAAVELNGKLKDLKEQIKDNEASLSEELMDYYKTSGVTEIEDENGQVHEFSISIRLKPKHKVE
jgi:hypothetical protein